MKAEQKKLIEKQVAKAQDFRKVFKSEQGKRVLNHLVQDNYVLHPTWNSTTRDEMLIREGARMAILRILTILEIDLEKLKQLTRGEENE